jgi:hypothetical protein
MNNTFLTLIIIFLVLIISLVFGGLVYWRFFLQKADDSWKQTVRTKLIELENSNKSLVEKLLGLDKLLEYSYQKKFNLSKSSLGAILKQKSKILSRSELNIIWSAHKLRNHIAHNIHFTPNNNELESACRNLSTIIKKSLV